MALEWKLIKGTVGGKPIFQAQTQMRIFEIYEVASGFHWAFGNAHGLHRCKIRKEGVELTEDLAKAKCEEFT